MSITLESSLNSLKLALAQFGRTGSAGQAAAVSAATAIPGVATTADTNSSAAIGLNSSAIRQLDLQRQLDSAYTAQAMLEVVGKNNAQIMGRLQNLKKVVVQATSDQIVQSERAFLVSQFEGVRKSLLSTAQNASWNGTRLFDGSAGSARDGVMSFKVGSGSAGKIAISLPDLREDAVRASGVRAVQGSLGPGTREQQLIHLAAANLAYTSGALSIGGVTLSTGALGASASVSDLVAGLSGDANYADAAFTLADNGANGLVIQWKNTGEISDTAALQLTANAQALTATRLVTGISTSDLPAVSEEQFISVSDSDLASASAVWLNDGSGSQNSFGLAFSAGTTLSALADALNSSYSAGMPFTVTAEASGLRLQWTSAGAQSGRAALAVSSPDASQTGFATSVFDASQVSAGADAGLREVQSVALNDIDLQGKTVTLSANNVTLSSGAMSSDATLADLVTALQADSAYQSAGFTLSMQTTGGVGSGLSLSWASEAAVSDLASLSLIDNVSSSTLIADQTTAGANTSLADGTREVQHIAVRTSAIAGRNVQLRAGDFALLSGTLDSNATLNQLSDALKANPRYDAAPFTISQERPGYLTLTWKTPGTSSQIAALEVQPNAPFTSLLRRGGISSVDAAKSMNEAIDLAMKTISDHASELSVAGLTLASAVQSLSSSRSSATPAVGQQSGTAYVNAISAMLRTQIAGDTGQAVQAQANFTPQAVISTLQFK
ncbi:MAG: hypothetical protein ACKOAO_11030 [Oxalobacteraceae bacterium]